MTLLAQTEVGEVHEGDRGRRAADDAGAPPNRRGGSSTLPHKNNPVAAISAVACAARAPGLVATLLAAMVQEHERAAGAWHSEWLPLRDLLVTVGSAAAWLRDSLERLTVDEGRMRANLSITHGLLLSERVTAALAPHVGRLVAHDLITEACAEAAAESRPLAEVLAARPAITAWLSPLEINVLLDPSDYLGSTQLFIDRALRVHAARHGTHVEPGGGAQPTTSATGGAT